MAAFLSLYFYSGILNKTLFKVKKKFALDSISRISHENIMKL